MRRSFGPMGGGGGGGAMMRTVHRAVRTSSGGRGGGSSQEPFSHFTNNSTSSNTSIRPTYRPSSDNNNYSNSNMVSLSSSHHHHHPVNYLNSNEYDDYVFATVPSMDEVNHALSSLQQFVDTPTNSQDSGWELDWIEPSTSMLQPRGSQSVSDAFRLLQTESSVQRMVVSLASDKSVWEAVMNNEAVRELRDSVNEANKSTSGRDVEPSDGSLPLSDILDWIFINTKAKVMEVLEKTIEMISNLFRSPRNGSNAKGEDEGAAIQPFEKKLKSSFLMSVLVMLIVVVTRASRS